MREGSSSRGRAIDLHPSERTRPAFDRVLPRALELVVPMAQPHEVLEARGTAQAELVDVVVLEPHRAPAVGYDAHRVSQIQGGTEPGVDVAAVMHHGADVAALADDVLQQAVAEQLTGEPNRNLPDSLDLAGLLLLEMAATQRLQVDRADHCRRAPVVA